MRPSGAWLLAAAGLAACVAPPPAAIDPAACDARTLAPGEVRARQIPCSDELIVGGEGRTGDWLIENAYARYVVRGTYAAMSRLEEPGGTLIDAAVPGGEDVLLEYLPDADRSAIAAVNEAGEARLELPGVTYRLGADDDALRIEGPDGGVLQGLPGTARHGAVLQAGEAFLGLDGRTADSGGAATLAGVGRMALSPMTLWPDGEAWAGEVDADTVRVVQDGAELYEVPVADGVAVAWLPPGATLVGAREGCAYDGLVVRGCGWLTLRVADDAGEDLRAQVVAADGTVWTVPTGGGRVPVGPDPATAWLWAGPAHSVATLALPGGDDVRTVTLPREMATTDVLGALAVEVAPDADTERTSEECGTELAAEGVGFAVLLADDEIPAATVDPHDALAAVAGSRAAGLVWSWPWSASARKPAHGAVPWEGLGALDVLAVSEGGDSQARRTVVNAAWVEAARAEAAPLAWDPAPDAVWLDDAADIDVYVALLDAALDVAPVGPRTWIGIDGARNVVACEAGIVAGRTSAGNGPRVALDAVEATDAGWLVRVTVDAPRWMGIDTVAVRTSADNEPLAVEGAGSWKWTLPAGTTWAVATVSGRAARPGSSEPAWAVSAPLWLAPP